MKIGTTDIKDMFLGTIEVKKDIQWNNVVV